MIRSFEIHVRQGYNEVAYSQEATLSDLPKFYIDAHISKKVAAQLRRKGIDCIHCSEVGLSEADDPDHLAYAANQNRIVVSCDKGMVYQHHVVWQQAGKEHAGIALIKGEYCSGERSIGYIVNSLQFLYELIAEEAGTIEDDLYNQVWRV